MHELYTDMYSMHKIYTGTCTDTCKEQCTETDTCMDTWIDVDMPKCKEIHVDICTICMQTCVTDVCTDMYAHVHGHCICICMRMDTHT